ncbi:unnamed protein product, partial [Rotaria sp. Silwood2]
MSLLIFNDFCQIVLQLIEDRIVSFRITLSNIISGWSRVSSSLKYHQETLLRRLHLINIQQHEFDKLLSNYSIKQVHTLLVDVRHSLLNNQVVEGAYLAMNRLPKYSAPPLTTLPNLSNTNHLRTLSI